MESRSTAARVAAATETAAAPTLALERDGSWLVARLAAPHRLLSWAIVGGGLRRGDAVAWLAVREEDLRPPVDERDLMHRRLVERGLDGAVGLMTSCDLDRAVTHEVRWAERSARCVVTVGLGNALRAGDPPGMSARVGTINLLCVVDEPLADSAMLEALALAAEARTLAVCEAGVASRRSGAPASGTGTDCIVIAAPEGGAGARYAGKHTVAGHLIGAAVREAVARGVADWVATDRGAP